MAGGLLYIGFNAFQLLRQKRVTYLHTERQPPTVLLDVHIGGWVNLRAEGLLVSSSQVWECFHFLHS